MGLHFPAGYDQPTQPAISPLTIPLPDVIKTRVQTWDLLSANKTAAAHTASQPLLGGTGSNDLLKARPSSFDIAKQAYQTEGRGVFFRGLGVCSVRAFVVNAVQWAVSTLMTNTPYRITDKGD